MSISTLTEFSCPYCMEINDFTVDPENDVGQQQICDCQVCCRPIEIFIELGPDGFIVQAQTDSE